MGRYDSAAPVPVQALTYLAVTDDAWRITWKILGIVGMLVAGCRVATGILMFWAMGWFGYNPFGPNTVVGNGSLFETVCGVATPALGGASFVGSLFLLQRKAWASSFLRACEIAYLCYLAITTAIHIYTLATDGFFDPGQTKVYVTYFIAAQVLSVLPHAGFSVIAIPLLTVGMRRQAWPS